jgi:hypothetical protein
MAARNTYSTLVRKLEVKISLEDLGIDGRNLGIMCEM